MRGLKNEFWGTMALGRSAQDGQQAYNQVNSGLKGLNKTVNVPSSHVLVPTKIAPQSYVRRWIVIRAPKKVAKGAPVGGGDYNRLLLANFMVDQKNPKQFAIKFSDWQSSNK